MTTGGGIDSTVVGGHCGDLGRPKKEDEKRDATETGQSVVTAVIAFGHAMCVLAPTFSANEMLLIVMPCCHLMIERGMLLLPRQSLSKIRTSAAQCSSNHRRNELEYVMH